MTELVKFLVTSLVDNADEVKVTEGEDGTVDIQVAKSDMGKVIGKDGKIAKAIRTIVKAAGAKKGVKYTVNILEANE